MISSHKRRILVTAVAGCLSVATAYAQMQPVTPSTPSAPPGTTPALAPSVSSSPIQMPTVVPGKTETAPSAFDKLASGSAFVSKEQSDKLVGFDRAFSDADRDKDGKLSKDEFNMAWEIYTGKR